MSLDVIPRSAYNEDHEAFRQSVRQFLQKEVAPNAKQWQEDGIVPKSIWPKAGAVGMLCPTVPEEYGGLGLDFGLQRHRRRGKRLLWRCRDRFLAAIGHRLQLHHVLRQRGAEEALAPSLGLGRNDHRHRHDRTRHRQRPSGDEGHRQERRQSLCHQRQQNLHHQRPERRPDPRLREDRHRNPARLQGHVDRTGRGRPRRFQARAATSTRSAWTRPTRRNCSSKMCACR